MMRPGRRPAWRAVPVLVAAALGACEQQRGGLSELEKPMTVSTRSGESYMSLGARLLYAREPELAQKAFTASLSRDGVSAEALTGIAIALQQQGLLTEARRFLEQARELAPNSVTANNNLGVVLFALKEYYPARDAFRMAFALSSGTSELAERYLNQSEEVIAQIELTGEVDPAITYRVERLGSSEFRLIETGGPATGPAAAEEAGNEPAVTE
jgi:Tfp pilus assembly protein PilF